jgi:topoisomerase-4 subunit A
MKPLVLKYCISCNPNGEAEVTTILLGKCKKLKLILILLVYYKRTCSKRNLVTKYPIKKIELGERNFTLLPRKVWFDDTVQRLNVDEGEFMNLDHDKI